MQLHADIYYWCAFQVFLVLKLFSNTAFQGAGRLGSNTYDYPEDQKNHGAANPTCSRADLFRRATRVWGNDLENLIPFSLLALAAAFCAVDVRIYLIVLIVFAISRIAHAASLLTGLQPHRTLAFLTGIICVFVLIVLIIMRLAEIMTSVG